MDESIENPILTATLMILFVAAVATFLMRSSLISWLKATSERSRATTGRLRTQRVAMFLVVGLVATACVVAAIGRVLEQAEIVVSGVRSLFALLGTAPAFWSVTGLSCVIATSNLAMMLGHATNYAPGGPTRWGIFSAVVIMLSIVVMGLRINAAGSLNAYETAAFVIAYIEGALSFGYWTLMPSRQMSTDEKAA
ncbi:hypothetical protein [Hydrocarboniphaga effusa]|uniref:hypothetical protein n=1 Tax=Hydrocarboniphaga effusa TaxID=243629 RepID=UPI003BAD6B17